jgi:hypothetical protein
VARLLAAKERMGLDRRATVDLEAIGDQIDMPEDQERAQDIADRAVTLVKNEGNLVPLRAPAKTCFLTLAESHYSNEGLEFAQEVRRREKNATVIQLDASCRPPLAGCGRAEDRGMRKRGRRGLRLGGGLPRRRGAGRRFPAHARRAVRDRQTRGPDRAGQSVPGAQLSQGRRFPADLQHRAAIGDRRGPRRCSASTHSRALCLFPSPAWRKSAMASSYPPRKESNACYGPKPRFMSQSG